VQRVEAYSRLAGVYDEIVVDPCHDRCAAFLHELWSADPEGVRSVLDLCCGTGVLAGELIALGYRVVGVDASDAMLSIARERLGPDAVLSRMTLPDLTIEGAFDAVVCTFDGFTYLSPDELRVAMAAAALRIRPAGWLVFDLHTDAMMELTVSNPVVVGESGGNEFVIRSTVDLGARCCDTVIELTRPRDGDPFGEQHRQYFHADADVRAALEAAGFAVTAIGDEYTYRPVDASTLSATWVARRESGELLVQRLRAGRSAGSGGRGLLGCASEEEDVDADGGDPARKDDDQQLVERDADQQDGG
jgi:predicted TPR repeat methyltransferase